MALEKIRQYVYAPLARMPEAGDDRSSWSALRQREKSFSFGIFRDWIKSGTAIVC